MAYSVNPSTGELEFRGGSSPNAVTNAGSSTDNALARFDGTTGKIIQNSNAILDDTGLLTLAVALPISSGGTGKTNKTEAFDGLSPTTIKGDLIVYNGTDNVRLPLGADNLVLTADSTQSSGLKWSANGIGDVIGPTSATDNALVRFDATTGKLIQNSNAILDDTGNLTLTVALPVSSGGTGVTTITGLVAGNGTTALNGRTLIPPIEGIAIANGNGATGNPTFTLANDLAAIENLVTNGLSVRTATDTWTTRAITAGTGIIITNGDGITGNPTISATGNMSWIDITGTNQTLAINTGYTTNNGAQVVTTLPLTAAYGSLIRIVGKGIGGWRIAQNALQVIHTPDGDTTIGTSGFINSTNRYCTVDLLCTVANTDWTVINGYGNIILN